MNTRRLPRISTTLVLSVIFALGACQDDGDVAAPELDGGTTLAAGVTLPDAASLTEELGADERQSQELASALSRWKNAADSADGPTASGPGPLMAFLTEASTFLEHDQKLKLVQILAEQRDELRRQRAERRQGRGGSARGEPRGKWQQGLLGGFADELDLSEEQRDQLEELRAEMREQMQALRGDRPRRGGPDAGVREEVSALREKHREQIQSILTDEQQARLQELREERRDEKREARADHRRVRAGQRLESLAVILDLSQEQLERVRGIVEAQAAKIEEIRDGFRAEARLRSRPHTRETRESHRALFETIRNEGRDQIRELLGEDQQELFDALEQLRPDRPAHRRHGHGRSGGGFGPGGQGPRR